MKQVDLTLNVSYEGAKTTVVVRVLDAPGPSGYQSLRYRAEDVTIPSLPEIDAVALQRRETLDDFLIGLMGEDGARVEAVCLAPRVPTLRKLLGAKPGETEIAVELGSGGGGQGD